MKAGDLVRFDSSFRNLVWNGWLPPVGIIVKRAPMLLDGVPGGGADWYILVGDRVLIYNECYLELASECR